MRERTGRALVSAVVVAAGLLGFGMALAAGAGAPARAADDPKPTSELLAETGRDLFHRHCASCHGVSAQGDGPVAVELRKPPSDLTRIAARRGGKFPAGDVAAIIDGRFEMRAHGTSEMPVWGARLGEKITESTTPDEVARGRIDALVAYLHTLQR